MASLLIFRNRGYINPFGSPFYSIFDKIILGMKMSNLALFPSLAFVWSSTAMGIVLQQDL